MELWENFRGTLGKLQGNICNVNHDANSSLLLKPSICHTWLKFAARYLKASLSTLTVMSKQLGIAAGLKQIREANEVLAKNMKQEPTDEPAGTAGAPAETAGAPKRAAPAPSAAKKPKKPSTERSEAPATAPQLRTHLGSEGQRSHRRQAKARKAARASKATAPTAEAKEPATKAPKTASAPTEAPRAPKRAAPPDAAKEPATKAPKKASASEEPEVSPEPVCSQPESILKRPAAATPTEKASVSFSGALQAAGAEAQRLAASVAPQLQLTQAPAESVAAGPVAPSADDDELDLDSVDILQVAGQKPRYAD